MKKQLTKSMLPFLALVLLASNAFAGGGTIGSAGSTTNQESAEIETSNLSLSQTLDQITQRFPRRNSREITCWDQSKRSLLRRAQLLEQGYATGEIKRKTKVIFLTTMFSQIKASAAGCSPSRHELQEMELFAQAVANTLKK